MDPGSVLILADKAKCIEGRLARRFVRAAFFYIANLVLETYEKRFEFAIGSNERGPRDITRDREARVYVRYRERISGRRVQIGMRIEDVLSAVGGRDLFSRIDAATEDKFYFFRGLQRRQGGVFRAPTREEAEEMLGYLRAMGLERELTYQRDSDDDAGVRRTLAHHRA